MDQQTTAPAKQKVLKGDFLFACSMLILCCIFITGLVVAPFWEFDRYQQMTSANATSTAFVVATQRAKAAATQQAKAAATAAPRSTEQTQYEYVIHFNQSFIRNWYVGQYNNEDGNVRVSIQNGVYRWKINDAKDHIQGTDIHPSNRVIEDFDAYIDSKFVDSPALGAVCSGLTFRQSALGWDDGVYVFFICNDSRYEVYYFQSDMWENLTMDYYEGIQRTDWNRIGIGARGDHFTFTINNLVVFEMTDDRRKTGGMGIFIELRDNNSAEIWFDNFGFQSR